MTEKTAILNDRLYVPGHLVHQGHLEAFTHRYTVKVVEPIAPTRRCQNCKWWNRSWRDDAGKQQFCHLLGYTEDDSCSDFDPIVVTREIEHTIESFRKVGSSYAFARGDLSKIASTFHDFTIYDERANPPLGYPLRFTSKLRPDQQPVADRWLQHGYGIIKSPTGSGKSVLLSYLIARLGVKTLLLSHEERHLSNLYLRLCEHTNLLDLEKQTGERIVGRFLDGAGLAPITLSTFQAFNSAKGRAVLEANKDEFGLVWVDECHHTSAPSFHHVFSSFNALYRGGTTATPTRKDQTHWSTYDAIGPITAEGGNEMLVCDVQFIRTGISVPPYLFRYTKYGFTKMLSWLSSNGDLRRLLLENVMTDMDQGRRPLVVADRRDLIMWLKRQLDFAGYNAEVIMGQEKKKKKQKNGEFTIEQDFDEISQRLLEGRLHCVIGTAVLNENIDIRPLDTLHLPLPSANPQMEEQRAGRIRRPLSTASLEAGFVKPKPRIYAYCYTGHQAASAGEKVRRSVYERLGFHIEADATREKRKLSLVGP